MPVNQDCPDPSNFVPCNGTLLQVFYSEVAVSLAQITSLQQGTVKATITTLKKTLDAPCPGIIKLNSGSVDGGKVSGELYFNPHLAGHNAFVGIVHKPPTAKTTKCAILMASTPPSTFMFDGVGFGYSTSFKPDDYVTANFEIKVSGVPEFV